MHGDPQNMIIKAKKYSFKDTIWALLGTVSVFIYTNPWKSGSDLSNLRPKQVFEGIFLNRACLHDTGSWF